MKRSSVLPTGYARAVAVAIASILLIPWAASGQVPEVRSTEVALQAAEGRTGLAVQIGRLDPQLLAGLARKGWLVQGLSPDEGAVARARRELQRQGLYGQASAEVVPDLARLPYADQLVNLIVADDPPALRRQGVSWKELVRVLSPGGVLLFASADADATAEALRKEGAASAVDVQPAGRCVRLVRRRPAGVDDWTHVRYDPSANRVSNDRLVDAPVGPRWIAPPRWSDTVVRTMIAADGRLYYVRDIRRFGEGLPHAQHLVAVDAHNGLFLWERAMRLPPERRDIWTPPWPMVAGERQVFLLFEDRLAALDGATGETVRTYDTTGSTLSHTDQLMFVNGLLLVRTADRIRAFRAKDAELVWAVEGKPGDFVSGGGQLFYVELTDSTLRCLRLRTGQEQWRQSVKDLAPLAVDRRGNPAGRKLFLCFYADGYVCLAGRRRDGGPVLAVLSAGDGARLSTFESKDFRRVEQVFYRDGLVWAPPAMGIDPRTGQVVRRIKGRLGFGSSTCQPSVCTSRLIFSPKLGGLTVTTSDINAGTTRYAPFATGGCRVGLIPANGLLYNALQSGCLCNIGAIRGLTALSPTPSLHSATPSLLQRGPAYGRLTVAPPHPDDWPTFRRDARRSGATQARAPAKLRLLWRVKVGSQTSARPRSKAMPPGPAPREPLTALTAANGLVFVAEADAHRLVALRAQTGEPAWSFTAGGRIDSPPTICGAACLFGSRDGWLYCLRSATGEIAWRVRLAPAEHRIVAFGQLESSWPAHGSVLVRDGVVYATAGRSTGGEGGIRMAAVDVLTGRVLWSRPLTKGSGGASLLSDLLVSDGSALYLRGSGIDPGTGRHRLVFNSRQLPGPGEVRVPVPMDSSSPRPVYLHSGWLSSLLDGSWRHAKTVYAKGNSRRSVGDVFGQLLVFDEKRVYGFRTGYGGPPPVEPAHLFSQSLLKPSPPSPSPLADALKGTPAPEKAPMAQEEKKGWAFDVPEATWIEAMALAADTLFVAGPTNRSERTKAGGFLWALQAADGKRLGETKLPAPPCLDGLIVAHGRLYLSAADGHVACFAGE